MTNFRPWIYFDSVLSLCNRQDGYKSSPHSQWSWGPNKVPSGGSHSDHSGCQEAQTGNIFRNRLHSREAGWGLLDLTWSTIDLHWIGLRSQELRTGGMGARTFICFKRWWIHIWWKCTHKQRLSPLHIHVFSKTRFFKFRKSCGSITWLGEGISQETSQCWYQK